jgi:hypothetical protein
MRDHLKILGWLYVAGGAVGLLLGVLFAVVFGTAGLLAPDRVAALTLGGVAAFVAILLCALSLPSLLCGWGLLTGRRWSRVLGIVLSALHLPSVPFGTALGAYGLWVLLSDDTRRLLDAPVVTGRVGAGVTG